MPYVVAKTKMGTQFLRMFVHMFTVTPYMQSVFFFGVGALRTQSIAGGVQKWRDEFWDAIRVAFPYWGCVTFLLYSGRIPVRYGNLLMDTFGFGWGVFLSWLANRKNIVDAQKKL